MDINYEKIDEIFQRVLRENKNLLFENEAYEVLECLGVRLPSWEYIPNDKTGARHLDIDKKYVLKAVHPELIHKTEAGAIIFDVTLKNIEQKVVELQQKINPKGYLINEQISYLKDLGSELLVGIINDKDFGSMLTFGFGGTATEYYKSIFEKGLSNSTLPVNLDFDENIFTNLPPFQIATGQIRGIGKKIDTVKILELLKKLREFARHYSSSNNKSEILIEEFEINPLVISRDQLIALDALIKISLKEKAIIKKHTSQIKNLLNPKSVCIIGVSTKNQVNPCNIILKKFVTLNDKEIYLIHPKEKAINNIKCFESVETLKEALKGHKIDLVIVGVPAKMAADITNRLIDLNITKSIQIISAGFAETEEGKVLQKIIELKLQAIDKEGIPRPVINGPNTLGNIYFDTNTLFTPENKSSATGIGLKNCALINQSGAFMITRISDLSNSIKPSIAVSTGNQMDLSVVDFLETLLEEKDINTYGLYIEGLKNLEGLKLLELSKKAATLGKVIVLYKAGQTKEGRDAAKGHTAAMAGDFETFKSTINLTNIILTETFKDFEDMITISCTDKDFRNFKLTNKNKVKVAALSNAGFEKCAIADHLTKKSDKFVFAKLEKKTEKKLQEIFEEHKINSIMDIHAVLDLTPMMNDSGYANIIQTLLNDKNVDLGIFACVPETIMLNTEVQARDGLLQKLIKIKNSTKKPFIFSIESGAKYDAFCEACWENEIICFRHSDRSADLMRLFLG